MKLATAALALTLTACSPLPLTLTESADTPPTVWETNTDQTIAAFAAADPGTLGVHAYAWAAGAIAHRSGWDDPRVAAYLEQVYRQQNPDGGYGIEYAWDAFQDGTINPADTTYAISLTDHVGPVFLDGYTAGMVEGWRVQQIVDLVETFPQVPVDVGVCVAYSTTPADRVWCVDNINTSAAWFLVRADELGFNVDLSIVDGIVAYERAAMIDDAWWWPYASSQPTEPQDWQHQATMVENMLTLDPALGRRTLAVAMQNRVAPSGWEQLGQVRLAPFDCSVLDRPMLDTTFDAEMVRNTDDGFLLALMAYLSARAMDSCDVHQG